jgi:hypothetical protein
MDEVELAGAGVPGATAACSAVRMSSRAKQERCTWPMLGGPVARVAHWPQVEHFEVAPAPFDLRNLVASRNLTGITLSSEPKAYGWAIAPARAANLR